MKSTSCLPCAGQLPGQCDGLRGAQTTPTGLREASLPQPATSSSTPGAREAVPVSGVGNSPAGSGNTSGPARPPGIQIRFSVNKEGLKDLDPSAAKLDLSRQEEVTAADGMDLRSLSMDGQGGLLGFWRGQWRGEGATDSVGNVGRQFYGGNVQSIALAVKSAGLLSPAAHSEDLLAVPSFRRGQTRGFGGGTSHRGICLTGPHAPAQRPHPSSRRPGRSGGPAHLQRLAQLQVEGDHAHALQPGREARPGRRRSPRPGGRRAEAAASPARPSA